MFIETAEGIIITESCVLLLMVTHDFSSVYSSLLQIFFPFTSTQKKIPPFYRSFFFPFGRSHLLQQGTAREKGTTVLSDNGSLGNRSNFLSCGEEKGAQFICLNSERKL